IARGDIGSGFVGKPNTAVRQKTGIGVAGIVDPQRAVFSGRVSLDVGNGKVIAVDVLSLVQCPRTYTGLALCFDPGVGGDAVLHDGTVFGGNLEILGAAAGDAV